MKIEMTAMLSLVALLSLGTSAMTMAQSEAEEEAQSRIEQPLAPGDGVTADSADGSNFDGHSQASAEAMGNMQRETDELTSVPNAYSLDSLSAEGHSDAAADAIESQ